MTVRRPDLTEVLEDLTAIVPALYKGVEAGATHARNYFQKMEKVAADRYDSFLFCTLLRRGALPVIAAGATTGGYTVNQDHNLALHVSLVRQGDLFRPWRDYYVHIRKALQGDVPPPGHSQRNRGFYRQDSQGSLSGISGEVLNLIVLWDADRKWRLKPELRLACTRGTAPFGRKVPIWWATVLQPPDFSKPQDTVVVDDLQLELEDGDEGAATEDEQ
jgi:hypothetical protein